MSRGATVAVSLAPALAFLGDGFAVGDRAIDSLQQSTKRFACVRLKLGRLLFGLAHVCRKRDGRKQQGLGRDGSTLGPYSRDLFFDHFGELLQLVLACGGYDAALLSGNM